ncbi:RimK family protein [Candidatus Poribacteria bacterium]|nr:RimK family protein [Candidatus Poribacteria bacterium]
MNGCIVVDDPKDWPLGSPEAQVIRARDYLTDSDFAQIRGLRIFNLCRSYRYQSTGYYVSLVAAARGHKPFPSITTIVDFKQPAIIRFAGEDLQDVINKTLAPLHSENFTLSIYFGQNMAKRYEPLCSRLFRLFPAPLVRCSFLREKQGWRLRNLYPIPASEVPDEHFPYVVEFAREFFARTRISSDTVDETARFDLAILHNPQEESAPSDAKALAKFQKAAEKLDFSVEFITREDIGRVGEFDALFIRETTNVNHHTYRFARRAQAEGLVVIDDPDSILRCSNKVYLAELLSRSKIPTPKTFILQRDNLRQVLEGVGLPCILKQPDSAFSRGVLKVSTPEEFDTQAKALLEKSELIIVQEFLPSPFDWRIGVLDNHSLYACKYHMAKDHWQVVKHEQDGNKRFGRTENIPLAQVPKKVLSTAQKAAGLVGDGLYGVDLKEIDGKCYVMEVNDNPDMWAGMEDGELKDWLYLRVMEVILRRVEERKVRRSGK